MSRMWYISLLVPVVLMASSLRAVTSNLSTRDANDGYGYVETSFTIVSNGYTQTDGNHVTASAPLEISFQAVVPTDAIYSLWEVATDENFEKNILRYNEDAFTRVFNDYGTFYVRFYCANANASKEWQGDIYTITITESKLLCPNAFTPYGSPGVNDEWKVKASSIIKFDCVIFNRMGNELIHLTSVEQGWDGRYKGRLVPPGVYYYVIKAEGSDGIKYNLSGDINLIGRR